MFSESLYHVHMHTCLKGNTCSWMCCVVILAPPNLAGHLHACNQHDWRCALFIRQGGSLCCSTEGTPSRHQATCQPRSKASWQGLKMPHPVHSTKTLNSQQRYHACTFLAQSLHISKLILFLPTTCHLPLSPSPLHTLRPRTHIHPRQALKKCRRLTRTHTPVCSTPARARARCSETVSGGCGGFCALLGREERDACAGEAGEEGRVGAGGCARTGQLLGVRSHEKRG